MTTKYRTPAKVWGTSAPILPVECLSETQHTITTPEGRTRKVGDFFVHHDTWAEAHAYLVEVAQERVKVCRRSLQLAVRVLGNIESMHKPGELELPADATKRQKAANALYNETMKTP